MKKILSILTIVIMIFALAACGGGSGDSDSQPADDSQPAADEVQPDTEEEEPSSEEDGQNPVMNFIGNYACDRASILVEADGNEGARFLVKWGSSAWEHSEWTMTGSFDTETLTSEYHDCVRKDIVYNDNGEIESEEEVYTGGHGFIVFGDDGELTLTWQDDQEHMADDMVFTYYIPDAE